MNENNFSRTVAAVALGIIVGVIGLVAVVMLIANGSKHAGEVAFSLFGLLLGGGIFGLVWLSNRKRVEDAKEPPSPQRAAGATRAD